MTANEIRISTRRDGDRYIGVLRQGRSIVIECGHLHAHRDFDTYSGTAARKCITDIVRASRDETFAADLIDKTRTRSARAGLAAVSAATVERWKAADADDADALVQLIATVRAFDVDTTSKRPATNGEPATEEVGEIPDWMLGEAS